MAVINLDKYAVSFWDSPRKVWRAVAAKYVIPYALLVVTHNQFS